MQIGSVNKKEQINDYVNQKKQHKIFNVSLYL